MTTRPADEARVRDAGAVGTRVPAPPPPASGPARRLVLLAALPALAAMGLQWTLPWRLAAVGWRPVFVEWWPIGFVATLFASFFVIGVLVAALGNARSRPRRAAAYVAVLGLLPLLARGIGETGGPHASLAALHDAPVRLALAALSIVAAVAVFVQGRRANPVR